MKTLTRRQRWRACGPALLLAAVAACSGKPAGTATGGRATAAMAPAGIGEDYTAQLARFREVPMHFDQSGLSERERALLAKLADATRLLDELFWEQTDPEGLALYRKLESSPDARDQQLRRLLRYNGGRYDLINELEPFGGAGPRPPGAAFYPVDLTRAEIEQYVASHPGQKAALYDPTTVVRRDGDRLVAVPYHVAYAKWLAPIVQRLREAAALSDDPAFARFLRMRADALLNDDYFASDLAWLDLERPKIDVIFAPYETYEDHLLGVKASYGAAVLVRNESESRRLEVFQKYVPDIQNALPLPAADRPSKKGLATPMEVMEAPIRGGDLRHGYQAVADNLPNDARVHEQKGTKKIFFRNYLEARTQNVVLPIAARLLAEDQARRATAAGYTSFVMMHEVAHGIGPAFARTAGGRRDIREAIGTRYSALEESKADVVSLFAVRWLAEHGHYPKEQLPDCYAARVADLLRTVRFGTAEAHGLGDIMQFNYLVESGAITWDGATRRYRIDFDRLPNAIEALMKELLEQEASGDRARTEAWFGRYGSVGAQLQQALQSIADVPVDIEPWSDYPEL